MDVSRRIGIPTVATSVVSYGDRRGLLVERFDRVCDLRAKTIRRLRIEDMTQALGAWSRDKYDFEICELIGCLREAGVDAEVAYDFVLQLRALWGIGYESPPCDVGIAREMSDYMRECCRDLAPSVLGRPRGISATPVAIGASLRADWRPARTELDRRLTQAGLLAIREQ